MSVLDSGTIDGMATDENGKALILRILAQHTRITEFTKEQRGKVDF